MSKFNKMIKNNENFWKRLQSLLIEKKINSKQLGLAIGVQGASITGWKKGSYPRADTAVKIAQFLGVSVEWLVTGRDAVSETFSREEVEVVRRWRAIKDEDRQTLALLLDTFYGKTQAALEKKEA